MIICVCKGLSDREIESAIECGNGTEEEVGHSCGAGTDCGSCLQTLRQMLSEKMSHMDRQGSAMTQSDSRPLL